MDTNNINEEAISKINRGFQFTLPQSFRSTNNLEVGDYLKVYQDDGRLIIEPVEIMSKKSAEVLRTLFNSSLETPFDEMSEDDVMKVVRKEIKASRKRRNETRN